MKVYSFKILSISVRIEFINRLSIRYRGNRKSAYPVGIYLVTQTCAQTRSTTSAGHNFDRIFRPETGNTISGNASSLNIPKFLYNSLFPEGWQSGLMHRSWKPAMCKHPWVRIPPLPPGPKSACFLFFSIPESRCSIRQEKTSVSLYAEKRMSCMKETHYHQCV